MLFSMNFIYEMNESPLQILFSFLRQLYVANLTNWFEEHVSIPTRRNSAHPGDITASPV
jgi:hypothetical protein